MSQHASRHYTEPTPAGGTRVSVAPAAQAARDIPADQSARESRALVEIVQRINQSLEIDRVFALIARHGAELLGADGARLGMLDGDHLVIVATHGTGRLEIGERVPTAESFCAECIRTRRPTRTAELPNVSERWGWGAPRASGERRNAVAVPLLVGDRAIGAIVVVGNQLREFDEHDEMLLLALASHAAVAIENARLYRASVRTMRHASILASAARSLALNTTPGAMYADIARLASTTLGADGVTIYLADAESRDARLVHADGIGARVTEIARPIFWETAGGRVVRTGSAEFRANLAENESEAVVRALAADGLTSVAMLPLLIEGRPRGLLVLRYASTQAFEAEQRQLLGDFGTHAAVALRNALQLAALEERAGRLAAVATVQQAISAAGSLDEVYAAVHRAVASVVDCPCFALLSFDEGERAFVPEYVVRDGAPVSVASLPRLPLGDGATSQTFFGAHPSIVACSRLGWTGHVLEIGDPGRIAVVLSAPIVDGERVLGVLQAQSYRQDAYDWEDVDLVMLVARQAGTAIVRARAYDAERLAREEAQAAFAIARVALGAPDVAGAAPGMLRVLGEVAPGAPSAIGVIDAGGAVHWVAAAGEASAVASTVVPFDPRRGIPGPGVSIAGAPGGVIPLRSRDRVIGVIGLASPHTPQRQRALLGRLAAPVALALDTLVMREEEERKRHHERTLATALETMRQPVFVCTTDAVIQHANGAAVRQYGYALGELVGMPAGDLVVRPAGQRHVAEWHDAMRRGGAWEGELLQRRKDGGEFPSVVTMSAIRDDGGRVVGVVVIVRDLTEERRVAEQLRQSEKLVALGELVAGVVHEVNNPLTGISAFAQLLCDEPLTEEQRESVQMIKREADRAVTVVRDLLTFARKSGPRIVPVQFNDLVEQTLRLRTYGLRTAGVQVELRLAPDIQLVHGDDRQLQQVLLNLIVNAEHAMATVQHRRLTIRTANEGGRVVVEVADTGIGMAPDVQKRIFEPFFTTKSDGRGTGLGLSVSYGIVQTHGGTLTVHSAPGAGATFRISLPTSARDGSPVARRAD
ncbi:MAG TPA: GAF domain-containing protein [Gemmatimonadaceae bacterium]|nr:GAF domain-containing protein [Gemmatimonadaceae bacterium]